MAKPSYEVLIIDDDPAFARLVEKHLKSAHFQVKTAHSATQGLKVLESQQFDAVILDHVLPERDGITLLGVIGGMKDAPPVVYLTGSQESSVAVSALKAGAADYVVKDVAGEFLILLEKAVSNAIEGARIKREKEAAEEEVRRSRDRFEALATERALLMREISHRVSNSLQLIASLLHFQSDISQNADVRAALKEANGRVLAVARVHRSLYTTLDVRWISLSDYLQSLIADLQDVTSDHSQKSTISFEACDVQTSPDIAVAIGIVATELVLNALKHAYPDSVGPVRVELQARPSEIMLAVEDKGVGAGKSAEVTRAGLGKRIISGMAEKVSGRFYYDSSERGMRAVFALPLTPEIRVGKESAHTQP
jgi:two-component sensor histidine kinase